ncbi:MAG TPA: Ig-like domain-containing protein, partial [Verrucomicrobiae bacterium]|nr:Ig-like domain-containing protein [Verrucomicrobiae bacterium]
RLTDNGGTANAGKDTFPDPSTSAVQFTITVTDTADLPAFSGLSGAYTMTKNTTKVITFAVNDPDVADQTKVAVTAASSDPTIADFPADIQIGVNGGNRVISVTPKTGKTGVITITLTAQNVDSSGNAQATPAATATTSFTLDVQDKNAPPTITLGTPKDISADEDSSNITYIVHVTDPETTDYTQIAVTATSDNQGVLPDTKIFVASLSGDPGGRMLIFTPNANSNGVVNVTVSAKDTGSGALAAVTSTATFKLTINPVNDAPTISGLPAKTSTTEDTLLTLPFTLADVDNALSGLTFTLASTNTSVVANSGITVTGTNGNMVLNILPVTNASGLTRIDIKANDGTADSATYSILLTVIEVNDPPVITAPSTLSTGEDENFSFTFSISDVESTVASKMLNNNWPDSSITYHHVSAVVISDPSHVLASTVLPLDNGAGFTNDVRKVSVTVSPHASGNAVIELSVTDTGDVQSIPGQPDNQLAPQTTRWDINVSVNFINHAPTIDPIASLTVNEDTSTPPLAFKIGDIETAPANLTLTGTSSDQTVVANSGIVFSGTATNRTVVVTPVKDANGSAVITVAVSDGALTNSTSFTVTVTPVNDPPVLSTIADQTTLENTDTQLIHFTVTDAESPAGGIIVSGDTSDASIVPKQNIFFGGSGSNRAMIITPARNASGVVTISVIADDGSPLNNLSTNKFKLTITGVNNSPTISSIADQSVDQNKTLSGIAFTVLDSETAPPFLVVTATASNPTLVPDDSIFLGGGSSNRTMAIVPATGKSGATTITVKVTDDGGASATTSFVLTVRAVNQPPTIGVIANQTISENTTLGPIPFTVSDSDSPSFTVSATSSTQAVVPNSGIALGGSGGNRTITIVPASNQSGVTTITIQATDDLNASSSQSFTVTVNHVNQLPTILSIGNLTTKEGVAVSSNFSVSDAETAAANLTLSGTSSNTGLLPNANITFAGSGQIRTVALAPVAGKSGSATVTVTVSDTDGGTASTSFTLTVTGINRSDWNGDGLSDIVFENDSGFLAVWFMNRTNQIGNSFLNPSSTGDVRWQIVGSGDFNGDGQGDMLFQHQDGTLAVWYMNGTNLTTASVLNPSSPGDARWHVAATADVNKDGKRDILFQHQDGSLAVWYMNGTTLISGSLLTPAKVDPVWQLVAAGDFNGDGDADLIFQNRSNRNLAVWYMHGATFQDSELLNPFDPLAGWHVVGSADYNGDGQADLIFQNDTGAVEFWFMKGPNGVERPFLNPVSAGQDWHVVAPR